MAHRGPSRSDATEGSRQSSELEGQAAQHGVNERGRDKACSQGTRITRGCRVINEYTSTALCFMDKNTLLTDFTAATKRAGGRNQALQDKDVAGNDDEEEKN